VTRTQTEGTTVRIREPRDSDAPRLATLLAELGYPTSAEKIPARLVRLGRSEGAVALVAELDSRVVGLITAHAYTSIHHDHDVVYITSLVVAESARRFGVGRRLVEAIEIWTRNRGGGRVSVNTALPRKDAQEFYRRIGFDHTGLRYAKKLLAEPPVRKDDEETGS
jgi:GNAT superfamily N-acetyltransferase